jgi:hypothetical protein
VGDDKNGGSGAFGKIAGFIFLLAAIVTIITFFRPTLNGAAPSSGSGDTSKQSSSSGSGTATGGASSNNAPGQGGTTTQPAPPPTPLPASGTIVYRADWSSGMNGWTGGAGWQWSGGMLVSAQKSNGYSDIASNAAVAPYQPGALSNYAIEASIRIIGCPTGVPASFPCGGFGVLGRFDTNQDKGYIGGVGELTSGTPYSGVANINYGDPSPGSYDELARTTYTPGSDTHTYRVEVQDTHLRLFIDGSLVLQTEDTRYLSAGRVGVVAFGPAVAVTSFMVIAL